jgi:hypothetical protein
MRPLAVIALALAASCDRSPARPGGAGSGSAAGSAGASDPWAAPPAPVPETAESRQRRAEAALGRVTRIEPEVARLRHLAFERAVPTRYQKPDEFRAFVRREIAKELPAARSRDLTAALAHLGFLARPTDLAAVEEQAMTTQAGAYYDPAAKAFFVVMVPSSDLMLDTMSAHELTHALQDQHFDLDRYLPSNHQLDDDAATARRFVAEGDATLVMLLYAMRTMLGDQIAPPVLAVLRDQIEKLASQDIAALEAQVRQQSALFGGIDGEIQKSIDAMEDIPPAVLVPLLDSYMKGALVALTAYEHGGWAAVDALYRDPPSSTEQVLHPATKLYPVRDRPRRVQLARSADPELAGDVLGELQWKIYFEQWKVPHAAEAAAGWGGDRYAVNRRRDGRLIGRIATVWDTPDDARQFADAYAASLAARFPGGGALAAGIARQGGGRAFVRTVGDRVFIVDGADDAGALDALVRSTTVDGASR